MHKSLLIICLLIVALALPAYAASSTYDPVVMNKTIGAPGIISIEVGDFDFNVASGNTTSIFLKQGNDSYILGEGDCKRFGHERLCHEEKISDNKARISVIDLRAHIESKIYADENSYKVGQEFNLYVTANNTGLNDAEQTLLIVKVPKNLSIEHVSRCDNNATHIIWEGVIPFDDGIRCEAFVVANGEIDEEFFGQISFVNYGQQYGVNSTEMELSAGIPFEFNISFSKLIGLEPLEPSIFTFNVHNNASENYSIEEVTVHFGNNGKLLSDDNNRYTISKPDYVKSWVNNLEVDDNHTIFHEIAFTKTNLSGTIEVVLSYRSQDDNTTEYTFSRLYQYSTIAIPATIVTSPQNLSFETLTDANYNISIRNNYQYLNFKGYNIVIDSKLHKDISKQLPYNRERVLAQVSFVAPKTADTINRWVNISVVALTEFGETFIFEQNTPITIIALQHIEIEKVVDEDTKTVTVFATNHHIQAVNVAFDESVSEHVFLNGDISNSLTLTPKNRTKVLSYSFVIDTTKSQDNPLFSTHYIYSYLENNISGTANSSISPPQQSIIPPTTSVNSSSQNASTNMTQPIPHGQKPSVSFPTFVWYLGVAVVLFIIAIILKITMPNLFSMHHKKIPHMQKSSEVDTSQNIIQEYNDLLNKNREIHERKKEYHQELTRLQDEVQKVNNRLKGFESKLPEESKRLDTKRKQVMSVFKKSQTRRQSIDNQIHGLQEQEQSLLDYEQRLNEVLKGIESQEGSLGKDYEALKKDQQLLVDEITTVQEKTKDSSLQQKTVAAQIREIKKKHAEEIKARINEISLRWEDSVSLQQRLRDEQQVLTEEFKKIEQDLKSSLTDVEDSEKIFKEAEIAIADKGKKSGNNGTSNKKS